MLCFHYYQCIHLFYWKYCTKVFSSNVVNKNIFVWFFVYFYVSYFNFLVPWCSVYHYCTTSFKKAWTQVLCRFISCWQHVGDSRWWGSLTMVPPGNKAKRLLSVNHTTKTIHHWLCNQKNNAGFLISISFNLFLTDNISIQ